MQNFDRHICVDVDVNEIYVMSMEMAMQMWMRRSRCMQMQGGVKPNFHMEEIPHDEKWIANLAKRRLTARVDCLISTGEPVLQTILSRHALWWCDELK